MACVTGDNTRSQRATVHAEGHNSIFSGVQANNGQTPVKVLMARSGGETAQNRREYGQAYWCRSQAVELARR